MANVRLGVGHIRGANQQAARWLPRYDGHAAEALIGRIETALRAILAAIDALIEKDFRLCRGSPLDAENPGTLAYLAIVSHSVSRIQMYDDVRRGLVANVNRG